jgi:hypothetical protein
VVRNLLPAPRFGLGFALVAVLALARPASAQNVSVRAYVSPATTVAAGRAFTLNVEVTGAQAIGGEPRLPDLSAFAQYLGSSTQTSMQTVNGRTSVALTLQYRYQALTEGGFTIPGFDVPVQGRTFTTDPISVTVTAAGAAPAGGDGTGIRPDQLFITAEATKTRVREGEPFVVEYRIWTQVDVTNFGMTSVPEPEGFWVEDLTPRGQPEVEQRTRDGVQYASAIIRRVALVPTGPGPRTVAPLGIEAQVRVRSGGGRDPFESFFGRSSLFGSAPVATTVLSNPLSIEVLPLPPGRIEPFSGVVGSLRAAANLDRDSVAANEAVTLTVRVSGDGNIRLVPAPTLDLPADFEVFPPEVSESVGPGGAGLSGSKTFSWVLIPRAPGRREIPSLRFGYFDTAAGAWRAAETLALPLPVSGDPIEGSTALGRGGVAQLRQDIRFIRLGSLELRRVGDGLLVGLGFWMFALLPLAGIGGAVALRRHWDRLEGDVAYARGRKAGRMARRRLAEARSLATGSDPRAFYAEVARALRGLVADRLNLAEAGLQNADVEQVLERAGVDPALRREVHDCLETCDRQRFAPPGTDPGERERFLGRAGEVMTSLDRAIR